MANIEDLDDSELIQLLKKDDNIAFTEIYTRYGKSLAEFAGTKLHHLEDARDILHDLFVKLWEDRHTLEITGNLKSYLFTATRYRIIDKIRRNVIREDYASMLQSLNTSDSYEIDKMIEAKELQEIIEKSLDSLPPRTKEIFHLSRSEHHTVAEIAQMLDLSEQTVKNQITTALKHLRQSIGAIGVATLLYWWI